MDFPVVVPGPACGLREACTSRGGPWNHGKTMENPRENGVFFPKKMGFAMISMGFVADL